MKRALFFIAGVSWLAYLSSFFLEAMVSRGAWHTGVTGWQAALLAASALEDVRTSTLQGVQAVLAALTNAVMLATPWAVFRPQRQRTWWVLLATVGSIFVDSTVLATWWGEVSFRSGYYAWLGSFILIAVALYLARHSGARWVHDVSSPRVA